MNTSHHADWVSRVVRFFADSKLTPLILFASLLLGVMAIVQLPREEEPQISVPMFDIFVSFPGASAQEVEKRIVDLGERKLWEVPGVEYIYSTAQPHQAMFIVRFRVGESAEESAVKLYSKVFGNLDFLPAGASQPLIKQRSIDDVPVLAMTFHSARRSALELRQIASRLRREIAAVPDVSETTVIGGRKRQFQIFFDPEKLRERMLTPLDLERLIREANVRLPAGEFEGTRPAVSVESDAFILSEGDLRHLVVGVSGGRPVYLGDVAEIVDGPDEELRSVDIRFGRAAHDAGHSGPEPRDAVTLAVSKRKGAAATGVCRSVLAKVEELRGGLIPEDVRMTVTRDYGKSAQEKSNELLLHMSLAIVGVAVLIGFALGWVESLVVAIAIPMTLALTLATFSALGFTLNRVTLFALIFSIGILVDDPIVDVENIVRHLRLTANRGRKVLDIAIDAVNEVRSPLILATFTVIAAILPMAFVSGLMGPYMRPIPIGASAAMVFSMVVAFVATPWAAARLLGWAHRTGRLKGHGEGEQEDWLTRLYRAYMGPLIYNPRVRGYFLIGLGALLFLTVMMVPLKLVRLKMLPFDNKNEFQVIINMPEGTPFTETRSVAESVARELITVPEVSDIEVYAGTSAPYNFNGLVRHYFLRQSPNQAELQVNLAEKHHRKRQSHAVAESVRPRVQELVRRAGGRVQVAEIPPGPPVLSTLVLELYGPSMEGQNELARSAEEMLLKGRGVTDVDTYVQAAQPQVLLDIDSEKASLNGIPPAAVAGIVSTAMAGKVVDLAHLPDAPEPVDILLRLPARDRGSMDAVRSVHLLTRFGRLIGIGDLVRESAGVREQAIQHKNLRRVSYVIADVDDSVGSPVYAMLKLRKDAAKLPLPRAGVPGAGAAQAKIDQYFSRQPSDSERWALKWDGEWQITLEVFRDLGLAFALVLILIYALTVGWFKSFKTPWVVMLPIPLALIGILPAHWMGGLFFTATSMIGMIAGAGIVVRNSIILVDFIEQRVREGMPLEAAVIDAGAVRFRPMLLTAAAVVVGAAVILFDPIFQGLAVALMAGEVASTLLSRTAVPVIYYMLNKKAASA